MTKSKIQSSRKIIFIMGEGIILYHLLSLNLPVFMVSHDLLSLHLYIFHGNL